VKKRRTRRPLLWASEKVAQEMGFSVVAGIDEVGLGPLAGPAVAAAVVLPWRARLPGLNDSKQLTAEQRQRLDRQIRRLAVAWGIGVVEASEIDTGGLTRARQLAMTGAVNALAVSAESDPFADQWAGGDERFDERGDAGDRLSGEPLGGVNDVCADVAEGTRSGVLGLQAPGHR